MLTGYTAVQLLAARVQQGPATAEGRRALAKAITLLESTLPADRVRADELLQTLLPHAGRAIRVGISGVPGVGKSTLIEALGLHLIHTGGHRVAVLAVDPSSSLGGGSILGDKTRMERLSVHPSAFIRPSPAAGNLGGVAEKTREALLLCEAAGFDVVVVETVGVGQSETAVSGMTDHFVLLQLPNAGDDLQAIKKGVMELADLIAINKADIDEAAATRAQAQISGALHSYGAQGRQVPVLKLSAQTGSGLAALWQTLEQRHAEHRSSGELQRRRANQAALWLNERLQTGLQQRFRSHAAVQLALAPLTEQVRTGSVAASVAARRLLAMLDTPNPQPPI